MKWTLDENQTLRVAIYNGATYDVIQRLLPGRTLSAIRTRVHEIRSAGFHGGLIVGGNRQLLEDQHMINVIRSEIPPKKPHVCSIRIRMTPLNRHGTAELGHQLDGKCRCGKRWEIVNVGDDGLEADEVK